MKFIIYLIILTVAISYSCSNKNYIYLEKHPDSLEVGIEYKAKRTEYKLKANDILYINLSSSNEYLTSILSTAKQQENTGHSTSANNSQSGSGDFYLTGYTIGDSGYVSVPLLGSIKVVDQTIDEAKKTIQKRTDEIFKGAIVNVKLVSFKLTFMGEVGRQTTINVYQNEINIMEALSMVGGVNEFGDRKNVLVVRKTYDGYTTLRVDLSKRNLLKSSKYWLQPNDMIIVEPLNKKNVRTSLTEITFYLSAVTSIFTSLFLLKFL